MRQLETSRLLLRDWRESDREPFAAMNADTRVMAFFPEKLDRVASDALIDRIVAHIKTHGFGLRAVEVRGGAPFIGFVGLAIPRFQAAFTPCVEIGWRLAASSWGRGYATEAARAVLDEAFGPLGLDEVVSFTSATNLPSRRVMERLGMRHDSADDFEHPTIAAGHPLRRHVLYRLRNVDAVTSERR